MDSDLVDCPLLSLIPPTLRTPRHTQTSTVFKQNDPDFSKEHERTGRKLALDSNEARFRSRTVSGETASYKDHVSVATCKAETSKGISFDEIPFSSPQCLIYNNFDDVFQCKEHNAESAQDPNDNDAEHIENTKIEAGLVEDEERKINCLVDTLQSSCTDFDEDERAVFLRQSLKIKPVELGVQLTDLRTRQGNDIRVFNNSSTKNISESYQHLQTSQIQPKSPLSAISDLHSRIASLKDKLDDPFKFSSDDDNTAVCSRYSNPGRRKGKGSLLPYLHPSCLEKTNLPSGDTSRSMMQSSESLSLVDNLHLPVLEAEEFSLISESPQNKANTQKTKIKDLPKDSSKQSLADAGMTWSSGVRRSTRIRSKPLEFWRGERFLYGRIDESLVTVIGVKKSSPGKDGEVAKLKVESFVPEDYTDLVYQAALH